MIDEQKQPENFSESTVDHSSQTEAFDPETPETGAQDRQDVQPEEGSASDSPTTHPAAAAQGEANVASEGAVESPQALPATVEALKREIEQLKEQLEQQTQQKESWHAQALRIAADFENFRRRTQREKEELELQVKGNTISELLTVVDNFERARSQIKPANEGEMAIHKSYQGVYKQFVEGLKRIGVSKMRPEGTKFDPNYHEAMLQEPTDEYPEGTVIEELVPGYLLGDRVLRHAMVKVAAPPEPVIPSEEVLSEEGDLDRQA